MTIGGEMSSLKQKVLKKIWRWTHVLNTLLILMLHFVFVLLLLLTSYISIRNNYISENLSWYRFTRPPYSKPEWPKFSNVSVFPILICFTINNSWIKVELILFFTWYFDYFGLFLMFELVLLIKIIYLTQFVMPG